MKTRKTIISIFVSIILMSIVLVITMIVTNRQVKASTCMHCNGKGTLCTGTVTKSERSSTFEDHSDWNCPYIGVETSDFKVYYRHCSGCDKSDRIFVGTCPGCGRSGSETEFDKHPKCGACGGKGYVGEEEPECPHSNWTYEYNSTQHRRVCSECGSSISDWSSHIDKDDNNKCDYCMYNIGSGSTNPDPSNPDPGSEYCPDGQHDWKCVGGYHHECTKCPATGACNPTETSYKAYDSVKHFTKRCPICKGALTDMENHIDENPKDGICDKCGYSMCDHSGGNHENGGVCEKCGQVYQTHKRSSTVLDYIHKTETSHTPRYKCTCPDCDYAYPGEEQTHIDINPKDGVCDKCSMSTTHTHEKGSVKGYRLYETSEGRSNWQHYVIYNCSFPGCTAEIEDTELCTFGPWDEYDYTYHYHYCIHCNGYSAENHLQDEEHPNATYYNDWLHTVKCKTCDFTWTMQHTMASSGDYNYCTTEGCGYKEPISGKAYTSESCSVSKRIRNK